MSAPQNDTTDDVDVARRHHVRDDRLAPLGVRLPDHRDLFDRIVLGHGIFDFIAFDRDSLLPYLSTARVKPGADPIELGKWRVPNPFGAAAETLNLRAVLVPEPATSGLLAAGLLALATRGARSR